MKISIAPTVLEKCPQLKLGILSLSVEVRNDYSDLLEKIKDESILIASKLAVEDISKQAAITAGRKAYKALGKDPARYRLSAEALLRRVVNGKGLYHINNVVDALNLVSIKTGISIGGYDQNNIIGDVLLDVGRAKEPYEAIGRGGLNMEFMPLLRDEFSAFGSPTSDSTRTMVTPEMNTFLMVFFSFAGANELDTALSYAEELLSTYADGKTLLKTTI